MTALRPPDAPPGAAPDVCPPASLSAGADDPAAPAAAAFPEWLADRYAPVSLLACGGASTVYRARELATESEVAVKVVVGDDGAAAERVARERRVAQRLHHAHVVRTLAAEARDGAAVLVTEYVAGGTLRDALREAERGPEAARAAWPYPRVAAVLRDVASALAHAHARGVVHRDVKPENILLDADRARAVLGDFGIAEVVDERDAGGAAGVTGTPAYMAPEQAAGLPADARADVYALGLVGWELLAGRRPWAGESVHRVLQHQQHDPLPALVDLRPDAPAYLVAALEGALAKDPAARWRNGAEFLRRLSPRPVRLPPVVPPAPGEPAASTLHFDGRRAAERRGPRRRGPRARLAAVAAVLLGAAVAVAEVAGVGRPEPEAAPALAPAPFRVAAVSNGAVLPAAVRTVRVAGVRAAAPAPAVTLRPPAAPPPPPPPPPAAVRRANAAVARAFEALAADLRRSAGPGHEPRALQALLVERRRWTRESAAACGAGADSACVAARAARKVADLRRRRARFAEVARPATAPAAVARKRAAAKGEHAKAGRPKAGHPKPEHSKAGHPKADHPKADRQKPTAARVHHADATHGKPGPARPAPPAKARPRTAARPSR